MKVEVWKKRKVLSVLLAVLLSAGLLASLGMNVWASEGVPMLEDSDLTYELESIGYATILTRGLDLQAGYSKIRQLGPELIYAGGTTLAERVVESVRVEVVLERSKTVDGDWQFVDSWQKESKDADAVTANKRVEVEGGWHYRVISTHYAGKDQVSSNSGEIYIAKP